MITQEGFQKLLANPEDSQLEFKAACRNFDLKKTADYLAALANNAGGKLVLGVADQTQEVLGTQAFLRNWQTLPQKIQQLLKIPVEVTELFYAQKRVLIFQVFQHFPGQPVKSQGKYLMRLGESLCEMDQQTLKNIFAEVEPDFSAEIVPNLSLAGLDTRALQEMRKLWFQKAQRSDYAKFEPAKMLRSLGLYSQAGLNYAALILLGQRAKIEEFLPDAEIIFEWRQNPEQTAHDFRVVWKEPFFAIFDEIWQTINARNIRFPLQTGFVQREIYAFSEKVIREVVLNAVTHRDYRAKGKSIFLKASPKEFFVESPGGLVAGVTLENILQTSVWRNRKIAEVLEKTDLVERSGQGMDDIFELTIRDGKGIPNLTKTDQFAVRVTIPAELKDANFVKFLAKVAQQKQINFSFEEIYALEQIREQEKVQNPEFKKKLFRLGLLERVGKGRGIKYMLTQKYYEFAGKLGVHTRLTGLARTRDKEFILEHLRTKGRGTKKEIQDLLRAENIIYIQNLLQELKKEGRIQNSGKGAGSFWILTNSYASK